MWVRGGWLLCALSTLSLGACSNGRGSVEEPSSGQQQPGFSVGGTVAGLSGAGLILRNNGANDLNVASDGGFAFSGQLANGASYNVTVAAQPSNGQTCTVANGAGQISNANVTNVTVTCTGAAPNTFAIRGAVSGLTGAGLVLHNNGGDALPISADGEFAFPTRLESGAAYQVRVATQPTNPTQTCSIANGSGVVGSADVTNVRVTCATAGLTVGGRVSGLEAGGLVLQNNGGDDLTINGNGPFTFNTRLASGATYSVIVRTQPSSQNCTVRNATGVMNNANVTNVEVSCRSNRYTIGGEVRGLAGSELRLRVNVNDTVDIVSNGPFAFEDTYSSGTPYIVSIARQPRNPTQNCTVDNGSGVVLGANVTNVTVTCTTSSFQVGGAVSGLSSSGLVLRLNDGESRAIASNGAFTFDARLTSGSAYAVSISAQPAGQTCSLSNASGTIGGSDVSNVSVACAGASFSVGGSVSGLLGGGLVLRNNGGDDITVDANGGFTFPRQIANGAAYNVTVRSQPSNPAQTCSVTRGSGSISGADVTNVSVTCSASEFTIGGTVRDLSGSGLVLRNNGNEDLAISSNGEFAFTQPLPTGAAYNVTVASQPNNPAQVCNVDNGAGVVGSRNVTNIVVDCSAAPGFLVRGRVEGLDERGLVLQNNGGDDLEIASNGRFTFPTRLPSGTPYNVTIARQPDEQRCEVRDGSGVIANRDINDVEVRCDDEEDDDDD